MRAIHLVGEDDAARAALCADLLRVLSGRGHAPASLSFSDTTPQAPPGGAAPALREYGVAVGVASREETAIRWRSARPASALLPLLGADVVVLEGEADLDLAPRVVLARSVEEAVSLGGAPGGLVLAVHGVCGVPGVATVQDPEDLADLVLERGFLLPGLGCEGCGQPGCGAMARRIVAGQGSPGECQAFGGSIAITMDGAPVPLSPFVAKFLRAGLTGMLGQLKGYVPGCRTVVTLEG